MRNSIQGPLLRTGHNSSFKALGETGYPVFKMAFQLREAIYRLDAGRDLARHLAVPQNDQGGDRTDWYSSFPGDVIPWSGASESERDSARQQFNEFQIAVQALSEQQLNTEQAGAGGDRRVFAQLLKSVVHFPDYDFVYLVNGVLVITFWGFIHPTGEQRNPMHWLEPSSVAQLAPVPAAARPVMQPVMPPEILPASSDIPVVETVRRRWSWSWRWLLWLVPALLLLALLLGLLRGCVPSLSLPGLPGFSGEKTLSQTDSHVASPDVTGVNAAVHPGLSTQKLAGEESPVAGTAESEKNLSGQPSDTGQPASPDALSTPDASNVAGDTPQPLNEAKEGDAAQSADPAQPDGKEAQNDEPAQPATTPDALPPATPAQGKPLTLPPDLPDGPAQFLNGQWRANGGIQDKLTGRPLQLQYNFEHGNGTVRVRQSSGVTCTGSARGNLQQGALSITTPEQMKCSDGSNFIVPNIECKSPASGHADCVGSNDGDKTFPIRMLQPNT